jgi:hypothetical protein
MSDSGVCKEDGSSLPCSNHGYGFAVYISELPIPVAPVRQEFCAGIIPICPVCDKGINRVCDYMVKVVDDMLYHGPCSRFAGALEALCAIGNEVGRPTTHYASNVYQLAQQTAKLDRIFTLVSKAVTR